MSILKAGSGKLREINRLDWTFFHLKLSIPPDQKKFKILKLFIMFLFNQEQKIGTKIPCIGSFLFQSGLIPCLFS